jgi:hypothetical protein
LKMALRSTVMQFYWDEFRRTDVHHELMKSADLMVKALFDHQIIVYME